MAMMDLHMMVTLTVRERTEDEFRNWLQACAFTLDQVIPAQSAFSVLKAE
jgi:hypothetical protein